MSKKLKRTVWPDLTRIIAIFLVLVLHSSSFPKSSFLHFGGINYIISFSIAKTCVPLFVMLSGALLIGKKEDNKIFFSKRILRLLLPWIAWTLVYTLVESNFYRPDNITKAIALLSHVFQSFWFLPMIASLYLLTPAIRVFVRTAKTVEILYVILLWFFVVSLLPYFHNTLAFPLHVDDGLLRQTINYLGYFLIGYVISIVTLHKYFFYISLLLSFLGIFIIVVTINSLPRNLIGDMSYLLEYISPGIILLSVSIFTALFHLGSFLQNKLNNTTRTCLYLVSNATFGVYFIHTLIQQTIYNSRFITFYPAIDNYLNGLILFIMCTLLIIPLQQIRILKRFVS